MAAPAAGSMTGDFLGGRDSCRIGGPVLRNPLLATYRLRVIQTVFTFITILPHYLLRGIVDSIRDSSLVSARA